MRGARPRQLHLLEMSIRVCLVLSGGAGLVYEIVWVRMLGLVFGHTVFAVTTVLAAFMAGLSLGAFLFGRLIDRRGRPLRVYGLLEAGIGLSSLLVPRLLSQAEVAYLAVYRSLDQSFFALTLAQFVFVFLILLVPTTLMGASLPVLAKYFVKRIEAVGGQVGDLYALNTFGAVLGSAAAGFVLLPAIGVRASTALAAAVNLVVAAWAVLADRRAGPASAHEAPGTVGPTVSQQPPDQLAGDTRRLVTWLVLAGAGFSGAASMIYEVTWTRALRLAVGSSTYAFSAMLTTFLIGLALGSFVFARIWGTRRVGPALFGSLQLAVGFSALALVPAFGLLPDLVLLLFKRFSPTASGALATQFLASFAVMCVPSVVIGATLPCAIQICTRGLSQVGRDIGLVYSVNTVGTIVGTLLAGFVLVPWLGAQTSMLLACAVNVTIGAAVLATVPAGPAWRGAAVVLPLVLFSIGGLSVPRWNLQAMAGGVSVYVRRLVSEPDPVAFFRSSLAARRLLYYREGINATVSVERTKSQTALKIDGKVDAGNGRDMMTQLMIGHLPVLLHPRPERVLVIGLGSGVSAGAVAQHPVVHAIDVLELEPAVVEASNFFLEENRGVLRDPRVRLVIGDGRNFLLANDTRYDVIASEPSNPWIAGVANLFSREFYQLARRRLADDGIMVQWLQGYALFPRELTMVLNTFRSVFPHATVWHTVRGDYLLVAGKMPLRVDYSLLKQRTDASAALREDLARIRLDSPLDLITLFLLDEVDLAQVCEGALTNTDDLPLLEFAAPLALYASTEERNVRLLDTARTREFPEVHNLPAGLLDARRLRFARVYWSMGQTERALEQLRNATPGDPEDVTALLERAKLLFALGEVASATDELSRLARLRPGDSLVASYLRAGRALRSPGAEDELARYGQTRSGDPNIAEAHNNLGNYYKRLGIQSGEPAFFDLAADALEAALSIEPHSYAVLTNLGNVYFELGRLEDTARVYRRAIELAPGLSQVRFNLGLVYERQGKLDLAVGAFEAALALRPGWHLPRVRLEQLHATQQRP